MILAIGEILADMIGEIKDGKAKFEAFCGGAPFNVAVNALRSGAKVGFIGKVGKDPIGNFLKKQAEKVGLDELSIQTDEHRNTTLAFVTITNGERDFAFYRHDTADFNIDFNEIDFSKYTDLNIVHLGSLMLSERNGVKFAEKVVKKTKKAGKKLSFDINFRKDIFGGFESAKKAYEPFVNAADILKFSDDEIREYSDISDIKSAIESIAKKDQLVTVTLGSNGSAYYINGKYGVVPTEKITPVDTTGAGDAFFGTFLANIEGKELTEKNIEDALVKANKAGKEATQFFGAVKL